MPEAARLVAVGAPEVPVAELGADVALLPELGDLRHLLRHPHKAVTGGPGALVCPCWPEQVKTDLAGAPLTVVVRGVAAPPARHLAARCLLMRRTHP